jgi:tartrate-resistant acid phosphatase type 5
MMKLVTILLVFCTIGWISHRNITWDSGRLHIQMPLVAESAKVFLVGDTGSGNENAYAVGQAMESRCQKVGRPDALVLLGDNAYPSGIKSIEDESGIATIMKPFSGACMGDVPIFAILGNHDWKGNYRAQIQLGEKINRWYMPARHYLVSLGDMLSLAMVDSNGYDGILNFPGSDMSRLQNNLLRNESKWKLMSTHHPLRSGQSTRPLKEDPLRTYVLKKRFCNSVDLWMSGHLHFMEHAPADAECRSQQFVVGSGGGELHQLSQDGHASPFARSSFGFSEIQADVTQLKIEFIDASEQSSYSYVIERGVAK